VGQTSHLGEALPPLTTPIFTSEREGTAALGRKPDEKSTRLLLGPGSAARGKTAALSAVVVE